MRHAAVLVAMLLAGPACASQVISLLPTQPLGLLVGNFRMIHVLRVESAAAKRPDPPRPDLVGVSFKTTAALKGQAEAPISFLYTASNSGYEGLFRAGASVLCFFDGKEIGILFTNGHWILALGGSGTSEWSCLSEAPYEAVYDGTTQALSKHVTAILAGKTPTITARAPQRWDAVGAARLWRIKAGLKVFGFVLSEESPHFVGWGSGDPQEVPKLLRTLIGAAPARDRIAAADLANLGPEARPALAGLRRVLRDPDPAVSLAAAVALARLGATDERPIETIKGHLRHADSKVRSVAAGALADLGISGRTALPELLSALGDKDKDVRRAAVSAMGRLGPGSSSSGKCVSALARLLKVEKDESVCSATVGSVSCFGALGWSALPALRERIVTLSDEGERSGASEAVALLGSFNPPAVELLAELLSDRRSPSSLVEAAVRQLRALGPRARLALPALRRLLLASRSPSALELLAEWLVPDPQRRDPGLLRLEVAETILAIDPEVGPVVVAPVLLEMAKRPPRELREVSLWDDRPQAINLLGSCGSEARPAVPALVEILNSQQFFFGFQTSCLIQLLGPEHRRLLPAIQRLVGKDDCESAEVLLRLGYRREAILQAARWLKSDYPHERIESARWLGKLGREARAVEPILRQARSGASGVERFWLDLTLWRMRGARGTVPLARARAALEDLLERNEGQVSAICPVPRHAFWRWEIPFSLAGEWGDLDAAIVTIHSRLHACGDTVAVLVRSLRDNSPHVRLVAAVALFQVKPDHPDLVPALQKVLQGHPWFFCYAAHTLAALGPKAEPLASWLQTLQVHPNEKISRAAERVLRRIGPALATKSWGAGSVLGAAPADLNPLWEDLAGKDAMRADLAVWRLAGAGSRTVAFLNKHLNPPPALAPRRIAKLIDDLDSDDFSTRERAGSELARAIESAAPALRRARSAGPSLEVRLRIDRLLAGLDRDTEPEQRRRLRALRLLEEIGSPGARKLLKRLSRGDPRFGVPWEEAVLALRRCQP